MLHFNAFEHVKAFLINDVNMFTFQKQPVCMHKEETKMELRCFGWSGNHTIFLSVI